MAYKHDVFVSHAVEDKIPLVNELCIKLKEAGLTIWYSGTELNAGDSITRSIMDGLNNSRYGIVVLSPNYIAKKWPWREFYLLLAREKDGQKVILPVLFNITPEELEPEDYYHMADRMGIKADKGLDHVVQRLLDAIRKDTQTTKNIRSTIRKKSLFTVAVMSVVLLGIYGGMYYRDAHKAVPDQATIASLIEARIENLNKKVEHDFIGPLKSNGALPANATILDSVYNVFQQHQASYRNEYEFFDGRQKVRAKKNVNARLLIEAESLRPSNDYALKNPQRYWVREVSENGNIKTIYAFINTQPVEFTIPSNEFVNDSTCNLTVRYVSNIRYIEVKLTIDRGNKGMKRHEMDLVGLAPEESYVLRHRAGQWVILK